MNSFALPQGAFGPTFADQIASYGIPSSNVSGLSFSDPGSLVGNGPIDVGGLGMPRMPGTSGGIFGDMNGFQKAQTVLGGLQAIGNFWNAFQQSKIAKKQLKLTEKVTAANLGNQISSYNTALADRARSRGITEGQSQASVDDYVKKNSLPAYGG